MFESLGAAPPAEPVGAPSVVESTPPVAPEVAPAPELTPTTEPVADSSAAPAPSASPAPTAPSAPPPVPADAAASEWTDAHRTILTSRQAVQGEYQQLQSQYAVALQNWEIAQATLPPEQAAVYGQQLGQRYGHIPGKLAELGQQLQQTHLLEERLGYAYREWTRNQQMEPLAKAEMTRREEARALTAAQVPKGQEGSFLKGLQRFLSQPYHDARDMPASVNAYVDLWRDQQATTRAASKVDEMGAPHGTGVDRSRLSGAEKIDLALKRGR